VVAGAGVVLTAPGPAPTPGPTSTAPAPAAAPLIVGDRRSIELIGLGGPHTEALLDRVAASIGAAVETVEEFWGDDWPHHIVVVAAGTDEQFRAAAGGGSAERWADVAAIAVADNVDPARRLATGQRIVLAPGAATMSPAALQIVLGHELFHYAARADTAPDAPRWLTEGVADFVARPETPLPGPDTPPPTLPTEADLDAVGPRRASDYDRAWWFAHFIADDYGAAELRRLYLAVCGAEHRALGAAVRDVLGTDLPGLLNRWQQWFAGLV
jgi:hypothetical protein